jgi:hypothetical protein
MVQHSRRRIRAAPSPLCSGSSPRNANRRACRTSPTNAGGPKSQNFPILDSRRTARRESRTGINHRKTKEAKSRRRASRSTRQFSLRHLVRWRPTVVSVFSNLSCVCTVADSLSMKIPRRLLGHRLSAILISFPVRLYLRAFEIRRFLHFEKLGGRLGMGPSERNSRTSLAIPLTQTPSGFSGDVGATHCDPDNSGAGSSRSQC